MSIATTLSVLLTGEIYPDREAALAVERKIRKLCADSNSPLVAGSRVCLFSVRSVWDDNGEWLGCELVPEVGTFTGVVEDDGCAFHILFDEGGQHYAIADELVIVEAPLVEFTMGDELTVVRQAANERDKLYAQIDDDGENAEHLDTNEYEKYVAAREYAHDMLREYLRRFRPVYCVA